VVTNGRVADLPGLGDTPTNSPTWGEIYTSASQVTGSEARGGNPRASPLPDRPVLPRRRRRS